MLKSQGFNIYAFFLLIKELNFKKVTPIEFIFLFYFQTFSVLVDSCSYIYYSDTTMDSLYIL